MLQQTASSSLWYVNLGEDTHPTPNALGAHLMRHWATTAAYRPLNSPPESQMTVRFLEIVVTPSDDGEMAFQIPV